MDIPQVLDSTVAYLQQLRKAVFQDEDPIEISDALLQQIESVSKDVKDELVGKSPLDLQSGPY